MILKRRWICAAMTEIMENQHYIHLLLNSIAIALHGLCVGVSDGWTYLSDGSGIMLHFGLRKVCFKQEPCIDLSNYCIAKGMDPICFSSLQEWEYCSIFLGVLSFVLSLIHVLCPGRSPYDVMICFSSCLGFLSGMITLFASQTYRAQMMYMDTRTKMDWVMTVINVPVLIYAILWVYNFSVNILHSTYSQISVALRTTESKDNTKESCKEMMDIFTDITV